MNLATPRPVFCLLGLPFDALSLQEAECVMRKGISSGERGILSTPNLNWVALAQRSASFRQSVLVSDCSVADGMPLVWLARLLGLPFPERVSGSDLIQRLRKGAPPLRVFFFGGLGDVAERAVKALNATPQGLIAVGALNPGKGPVAGMSSAESIAAINATKPDIVIVSLGAEKGQEWILRNRASLDAAWVTHLGAVVNFFAGEVKRAPRLVGQLGLEWLWRIMQEPNLARRYWMDGKLVLGLLLGRLLPMLAAQLIGARTGALDRGYILDQGPDAHQIRFRLVGDFRAAQALQLSSLSTAALKAGMPLRLDLSGLTGLDAATLGQLLLIRGKLEQAGQILELHGTSTAMRRIFRGHCADYLLPGDAQ